MKSEETIFTKITRLANQHNAYNLGQGFPNFPPDARMTEILGEISNEAIHQYAPLKGNPSLIERIIEMTQVFYKRSISSQNVLVTAGATQAIYTTINAFIKEGDEVIVFDPAYDCYDPPIRWNGGVPIHLNLSFPDFKIDWNQVLNHISKKTKMIILNNPHNPSGSVFTENDISVLKEIIKNHPDLIILSDEVYEYISFEKHLSLNRYKDLAERSIIVSSFGKTLHLTGWKIGYIISTPKLLDPILNIHQFNVFSVNSLCQAAIAKYIDFDEIKNLAEFFLEKKQKFLDSIQSSKFRIIPSNGTYFQLLDYTAISDKSDTEMVLELIEKYKVAAIPISGFYQDNTDHKVLRFCFGKDSNTLQEASKILCRI